MHALVTGAAGFVGSHLVEALVADGAGVRAVDSFTPYYDVGQKRANWDVVARLPGVEAVECDLIAAPLEELLDGVDVVFHQAGQPGVRASWGEFDTYVSANIDTTRRLLEVARRTRPKRFVFASSSSVYGDADVYPTDESTLPRPMSPYGVTKLAAEHLAGVYARNWDVPVVALRYFTVYGPRQRPDMAMYRLIDAARHQTPFPLFGTGEQIRDFTFVTDIVAANLAVAEADVKAGSVFNVAGGGAHSMNEVIDVLESILGSSIALDRQGTQAGDVIRTGGSVQAIADAAGWRPRVDLETGLRRQVAWHLGRA